MSNQFERFNLEVTKFLDDQNHPLSLEINALRKVILESNSEITENIKWNAPNYCYNQEDRLTLRINPPKQLQLIFHRGAKKLEQPNDKLIMDKSRLLLWKENDRAIATFKNMQDIENCKADLSNIVVEWINATK